MTVYGARADAGCGLLARSLREYWQFSDGTHEPKPGWGG
jgi:hypothetical protein